MNRKDIERIVREELYDKRLDPYEMTIGDKRLISVLCRELEKEDEARKKRTYVLVDCANHESCNNLVDMVNVAFDWVDGDDSPLFFKRGRLEFIEYEEKPNDKPNA